MTPAAAAKKLGACETWRKRLRGMSWEQVVAALREDREAARWVYRHLRIAGDYGLFGCGLRACPRCLGVASTDLILDLPGSAFADAAAAEVARRRGR